MSTAASPAQTTSRQSLHRWLAGGCSEHFVFVYGAWMSLYVLAPAFMRMGWDIAGLTLFYIAFVFLLPIQGAIFLFVCSNKQ